MNGIEIRAGLEEPEEKGRPAAALLFLEAGVFGILLLFGSLKGISYSGWAVYPVTALLCWAIWYTCYGSRWAYLLLVVGAVVAYGAVVFGMEDVFREQIRYIEGCILGGSKAEPMDVTETVLLMAALLAFFTAMLEFLIRSHRLLYFMTTGLLLLAPLWGIRVRAEAVFLLALFQAAFWILQTDGGASWRASFEGINKRRILEKSSLAMGIVMLAAFLAAFPLASVNGDRFYTWIYQGEGQVYRMMNRLAGKDTAPVTGGTLGRGNQYRTGTPQLEVEADLKPTETLYLCGFEGDEYVGGGWSAVGEGELFETVEEKLGWQMYSNGRFSASSLYSSMYFMMNTNVETVEPPQWRNLRICHLNGAYENMYAPYYSQRGWGWGGAFYEGYLFWYYEQQDMNVIWDKVYDDFTVIRDWYRALRDAYMDEMRIVYTKVPVQLLPRLTSLCSENHHDSLEEITAFILYTLHENAEYTMTPGWAPLNEDIVEYFLFDSGRGYCEHFAAAATLMYRLYGIPARYASGYMVQPDAFEQQELGSWKAVVTDREAHAWVEIFLEDYGWTPVEVTPAAGGGNAARYPGFDDSIFRNLVQTKGWDAENSGLRLGAESRAESAWQPAEEFFDIDMEFEKYEKWLHMLGAWGIYSLCLLPVFMDYRRLRRLKKLESMSSRRVFFRVLEMLRFAGIMPGYDGTEADFAAKLAETTGVPEADIARMQNLVSEAAYGEKVLPPEAENEVRKVYLSLAEAVYKRLRRHKRFGFRCWKAFF